MSGAYWLADLKTTSTADPARFAAACLRLAYHAQMAFYRSARRAMGERCDDAFIIGVETSAPIPSDRFPALRSALEEGAKPERARCERLAVCEDSDEWPGYAQSVLPLDVPDDIEGLIIDGEEIEA